MIAAAIMVMLMQASPTQQVAPAVNPPSAPLTRPPAPTGNPGTWVTEADYPSDALHADREGIVGFQLEISPQGTVDNCATTTSSGTPSLDEKACQLLQARAHFRPARDEKGNLVAGTWGGRVKWALPRRLPADAAQNPVR